MALKTQASFSSGELDPALHERTSLQKYQSGLTTARNVVIGKTGRLTSRAGRRFMENATATTLPIRLLPLPNIGILLEWGHLYVKRTVVNNDGSFGASSTIVTVFHGSTLVNLRFSVIPLTGEQVFISVTLEGTAVFILEIDEDAPVFTITSLGSRSALTVIAVSSTAVPTGAPTGYSVEYLISFVSFGVESATRRVTTTSLKRPITAGQSNKITGGINIDRADVEEMRVYRRPFEGGAYGYIGSSVFSYTSGTDFFDLVDFGQAADFSRTPQTKNPSMITDAIDNAGDFQSVAGSYYQQRHILSYGEKIEVSRIGRPFNFFRDYPYASANSLSLSTGSSGDSKILHFIDSNGLVAFTTGGVYVHTGAMGVNNLSLDKKGDWVIDTLVPPIAVPGGVLFIDSSTNTVRQLLFSLENGSYIGEELSIFSDHLFRTSAVVSWAFEDGVVPLLWITFKDHTYASFTYEKEHNMKAWTRHDSGIGAESLVVMKGRIDTTLLPPVKIPSRVFFVMISGTTRIIESSVPRYVSTFDKSENPEADKGESIAAMDSMVSYSNLINDGLAANATMVVTPVVPGDFEGLLDIVVTVSAPFVDPGIGEVGTIYRHFDINDGTAVDLEIITRTSDTEIRVQPSAKFPSTQVNEPRLYVTKSVFTGLTHLEGLAVSVVADGYVIASPNNDIVNYPTLTVSGGQITLPSSYPLGAIVHIGRPYVSDIETLSINTVEQSPVFLESKLAAKVFVSMFETRTLYVGQTLPKDDKVKGMEAIDERPVNLEDDLPIPGNRYDAPLSRRAEVSTSGDWDANGKIAIRNVDPIHFEILSIIPDLEILKRGR